VLYQRRANKLELGKGKTTRRIIQPKMKAMQIITTKEMVKRKVTHLVSIAAK